MSARGTSRRTQLLLTSVAAVLLAVFVWLAIRAPHGVPGVPAYRVSAQFADLSDLAAGDEVRIAGVHIGSVDHPRVQDGHALVTLVLQTGVRPLPRDTRAEVRSRGLLGARYLELIPGRSAAPLPDGATIPERRTSASVALPAALLAFDAPTREHLRGALDGLGRGFASQGVGLNDALRELPAELGQASAVAATLRRSGALRALAPGLDAALGAIDPVRDELAATLRPARLAALPFAEGRDAVGATLDAAPGAFRDTHAHLAGTSGLLAEARRLAVSIHRTLPPAPAALAETARVLRRSARPLARTVPLLDAIRTSVPGALGLVDALPPLLTMLDGTMAHTGPLVRKLGTIQCDIHRWATNWQSMLNVGVTVPRGDPSLGPMTSLRLTAGVTPDQASKALNAHGVHVVGSNPFPAPCQAGSEKLP